MFSGRTTFVISIKDSSWRIERLGDTNTTLHDGVLSEHDAEAKALLLAKEEGNVVVIKSKPTGEQTVIARFGDLKSHASS